MRICDVVGLASVETMIKIWDEEKEETLYEGNGLDLIDASETDKDSLSEQEVLLIRAGEGVLIISI